MWERASKNRDGMWEVIRKLRTFTRSDIVGHTDHNKSTVNTYLTTLHKAGYLSLEERPCKSGNNEKFYTLIRDIGRHRPRIDGGGKQLPPSSRQRIWAALKVVGQSPFDWRDIAMVAATTLEVAKEYCCVLAVAGYLRVVRESKPGTTAQYVFPRQKDTGPKAPQLRKRKSEIYDPNTDKVVWTRGAAQ